MTLKKKTMKQKNRKNKKTRSKRGGKSLRLKQRGGGMFGDESWWVDALGVIAYGFIISAVTTYYNYINNQREAELQEVAAEEDEAFKLQQQKDQRVLDAAARTRFVEQRPNMAAHLIRLERERLERDQQYLQRNL